jgi:branched-chain amino acid transport system substrate-binding protein
VAEQLIAAVATKGSPHQPNGAEVIEGAMAAAERINSQGGVLGESVRVVAWSEDCTRERAVQIAEEISRLKPAAVVGHVCAGAALAAAPVYAKAGVLLIVPGVRHPGLTTAAGPSRLVLRLAGRDDRFAAETVHFIAARYPGAGVALVADRTRQARSLATAITTELARQKVALRYDERIESSQKSYDPVASRVRASGAGVVVMPAQPIELGIIASSLRRAGVEAPLVGSEILAVPSVTPTAQREGSRLVVMLPWTGGGARDGEAAGAASELPDGERERRAARLRAEAAVEAWVAAVRRAGSPEPDKVADAARAAPAATVVGAIQFDEAGDAMVPSYIPHVWRDGAWRPVARSP